MKPSFVPSVMCCYLPVGGWDGRVRSMAITKILLESGTNRRKEEVITSTTITTTTHRVSERMIG